MSDFSWSLSPLSDERVMELALKVKDHRATPGEEDELARWIRQQSYNRASRRHFLKLGWKTKAANKNVRATKLQPYCRGLRKEDAEDIAQDTTYRVLRAIRSGSFTFSSSSEKRAS